MVIMEKCQTCKFYMSKNGASGLCRRSPPTLQVHQSSVGVNISVFPPMIADDWCGEFINKESKQ